MYTNTNPYALWFGATLQVRPGESFELPKGYTAPDGCVPDDQEANKQETGKK